MSIKIVCPSGFAGEARRWKGLEVIKLADSLEDDEDIPDGGMSHLLHGPWETTTNTGPYRFITEGTTKPDWSRMLKGDILGALYQMRIGSFRDGANYDFDFQCERPRCRKGTPWTIDLHTILEREQKLPKESFDAMREGVDHRTTLFDGTELSYKLGSTAIEKDMNALRKQQVARGDRLSKTSGMIDAIAAQVSTVAGARLDIRERWKWASELDLDDLIDIADKITGSDCGYETEIEVKCMHCNWVQGLDLPLGKSFLVPTRGRRSKKADHADPSTTDQESTPADSPK